MKTKTTLLIFLIFTSIYGYSQSSTTYDITFTSVWNATDHGALPGNAHWSKLVGANHNSNITFLQMGQNATPGIEDIAELGDNANFNTEVNTSITAGNTEQYIDGNSLGSATGTITITDLMVTEDFPLLTLVSMIAPSPDWMIAVNSINLRESGSWKSSITIDLFPYDAGTDNGVNYTSSNANNTGGTITSLVNVSPFNDKKIGTLTITLKSVLDVNNLTFASGIKIYPNPSNGLITIDNQSNNIINSLNIYDVEGNIFEKVMFNAKSAKSPIRLKNLSSGMYFLKFSSEEGLTSTKKIIVE